MSGLGTERRFDVSSATHLILERLKEVHSREMWWNTSRVRLCLVGAMAPMATYRIIDAAPHYLKPGGLLAIETSPIIGDRCLEKLRSSKRLLQTAVAQGHCFGNKRILSGIRN